MPEIAIIVSAKDKASATLGKVGGGLQNLGKVAAVAGAAGVAALGGIALGATKLALDAAQLEPTRVTFENLSESIGSTADAMLNKLRPAAMGVVSDADLMQAANKLMAMGLAETEEEAAKLTEMATTLGMAMGEDATASMENFALMLANQSIPRLDSFGISSGKVRERILELMEADKSLTREQAFMTAVMEQGEVAMGKVGDISGTSAVTMAQMSATIANLKMTIGEALLPVLKRFLDFLQPLIQYIIEVVKYGDPLNDWLTHLPEPIRPIIKFIGEMIEKFKELIGRFQVVSADAGPGLVAIFGKVADWINDNVIPAVRKLWEWISNNLIPTIRNLWDWISGSLIPILVSLTTQIVDNVVEAVKNLWSWLEENLGPIVKDFADEMFPRFQSALQTLYDDILVPVGEFIRDTVIPALQDFWDRTEGIRQSIVDFMGSAAVQGLKAFLEGLVTAWDLLGDAINAVKDALSWLIEKIKAAISWLSQLWDALPSWLVGGGMAMPAPTYPAYATLPASPAGTVNIFLGGVSALGDIPTAVEEAVDYAARYAL